MGASNARLWPSMPDRIIVAVIDSGVQPTHPHIVAERLLPGLAVMADGTMEEGADAAMDRLGHGTAVTAAIQEKAPEAMILPIRVFHDALRASPRALIAAIDRAGAAGAAFINLSLGTTNPAHAAHFAAAVARCAARIVAPREAEGLPCWPGALDGVLAVGLDWDVPRESVRREGGAVFASGHPRPIPGVPQRRNLHGVSFATANVCGLAAAGVIQSF
ncbi:MAG: hypothetical protein RIS94_837 [Pseudomonadota bacterium]|jgi:hypothetical protein